jgi:glutamate-1-semialdehyde 2,1-aminomutase
MFRYDKSLELLDFAQYVTPLATQTFSKGYKYFPKGAWPVFIDHAKGAYVWDIDKNKYIDFICGLCPITLGWQYPVVDNAIRKQLKKGIIFSLPSPLESELASMLIGIIPGLEMVRFFKTGSEACSAAVRAARAFTGRSLVLSSGYHGWHDTFLPIITPPERQKGMVWSDNIIEFRHNNINALEPLFDVNKGSVAAVIMEPVMLELVNTGYLQAVKELCHKNGALLIFDEVVTGFRWAIGGAAQYFNVIPDLVTFGKGMGNGMPIGAVGGRRDIMQEFETIMVSSTFGGECLSLAASMATIHEMLYKQTIDVIWRVGYRFMTKLRELGIDCYGYPCRFQIKTFDEPKPKALFLQYLAENGILIHSGMGINLSYSHTNKDIDRAVRVIAYAINEVSAAIHKGTLDNELKGEIISPAFKR